MNHDVSLSLGCLTGNGHVSQDGQVGEFLNVLMSLNLKAEERDEIGDESREGNAKNERDEINEFGLRAYLAGEGGQFHNLGFVGGSGKFDGVFLTFLQ